LQIFLNYLNIDSSKTIDEKSNLFYSMIGENSSKWLECELLKFFTLQNQRAERKEISTETIKNYLKPVKLFCEMNGVIINWKIISKGIKRGNRYSNDRPPTREEINKLLEYPDRRIKPIVLVMVSSGIRVGSWNYLKWGDIMPITKNGSILAAKIKVFNTKTTRYYSSFITIEAFTAVKEWMDFRASFGENITPDSWIMRNLWQIKSQHYGNYLGLAKHPKKFSVDGIRMLINDAWKIQGVREKDGDSKKYPFKSLSGFRKFFETECQKVVKSINVSILMSNDTGITQHYYKPREEVAKSMMD
jgi:integrase